MAVENIIRLGSLLTSAAVVNPMLKNQNNDNKRRAHLGTFIFLIRHGIRVHGAKYAIPISELVTSPDTTMANSGLKQNSEYVI